MQLLETMLALALATASPAAKADLEQPGREWVAPRPTRERKGDRLDG